MTRRLPVAVEPESPDPSTWRRPQGSSWSAIPPEAWPYMTSEYIMNTERLQKFLGPAYDDVIRYSIADAYADSFNNGQANSTHTAAGS